MMLARAETKLKSALEVQKEMENKDCGMESNGEQP